MGGNVLHTILRPKSNSQFRITRSKVYIKQFFFSFFLGVIMMQGHESINLLDERKGDIRTGQRVTILFCGNQKAKTERRGDDKTPDDPRTIQWRVP